MYSRKLILWYFFLLSLIFFLVYLFWYAVLPWFLWSFILYSLVAFVIHRAIATMRGSHKKYFIEFFILFLYKFTLLIYVLLILVWYFVYHQTHLFPAKLPKYTLSNWEKILQFQTMSHIWSQSFYDWVEREITAAKNNDYTLYFEWVTPGSVENKRAFDKALWIKLESDTYESLARLYGIVAQDNQQFLNLVNSRDKNIDLNLDQIMDIYRENIQNQNDEKNSLLWEEVYDVQEQVLKRVEDIDPRQLFVLRYFNQAFLNFMMKHSFLRDGAISLIGNQDIFSVILDERNAHLANTIHESEDTKIIVIYWLLHFQGVFELLQQHDSNWEITNITYKRVITPDAWSNMWAWSK